MGNAAFENNSCGIIKMSGDYPDLTLMQRGHKTWVSHLMTLGDHIFVIVPKIVEDELESRLRIFACGRHLVAFDGAALLVNEIYHRLTVACQAPCVGSGLKSRGRRSTRWPPFEFDVKKVRAGRVCLVSARGSL